ncbi:AMP-binding protein [Pengzhenrongella sicca]|uniref:AMP-binding protein n=1 Tax=Pengzhenrongella sicca TaxID=2819238 RepID=A0A8A4ZK39_9MICO|nr:AMP-binding protein [Pengzhenrongella sicca]QTE30897.1 AMP-binding protein [Pengzhenrongella sicca]
MTDQPTPERVTAERAEPERDLPDVLGEYVPRSAVALTDAQRWPTQTVAGERALRAVREHPHAPEWVHECGDRLDAGDLAALADLAADYASRGDRGPRARAGFEPAAPPAQPDQPEWVGALVRRVHASVPRYRRIARLHGLDPAALGPLADVAPIGRAELAGGAAGGLADLVPVDVELDRLIEGSSSGSTGSALVIALHPRSVAGDLMLLRHLLRGVGVEWRPEPGRLALASVVAQDAAFTYASTMSAFGHAPMARVNLDPGGWRRPGDREAFLAATDPQVITTSPWPLLELADLDADLHPLAVVSGAAALTPAARARVRDRWGVPVLDLYGLRETGPLAVSTDGGPHVLVPRRIHVEILDPAGTPVADGVRGEIVVTVDDNPYLPLLRYRTGDVAALVHTPAGPALAGLEGREPVRLRRGDGAWSDCINATQLLQAHGLLGWRLHQLAGGDLTLAALGGDPAAARLSLERLLDQPVTVTPVATSAGLGAGKPRRYTSDLPGGA